VDSQVFLERDSATSYVAALSPYKRHLDSVVSQRCRRNIEICCPVASFPLPSRNRLQHPWYAYTLDSRQPVISHDRFPQDTEECNYWLADLQIEQPNNPTCIKLLQCTIIDRTYGDCVVRQLLYPTGRYPKKLSIKQSRSGNCQNAYLEMRFLWRPSPPR
jgi:hypothetical protein